MAVIAFGRCGRGSLIGLPAYQAVTRRLTVSSCLAASRGATIGDDAFGVVVADYLEWGGACHPTHRTQFRPHAYERPTCLLCGARLIGLDVSLGLASISPIGSSPFSWLAPPPWRVTSADRALSALEPPCGRHAKLNSACGGRARRRGRIYSHLTTKLSRRKKRERAIRSGKIRPPKTHQESKKRVRLARRHHWRFVSV